MREVRRDEEVPEMEEKHGKDSKLLVLDAYEVIRAYWKII